MKAILEKLVSLLKADPVLNSATKGLPYIAYRDLTNFAMNNIYYLQNLKQFPAIVLDGNSSRIEPFTFAGHNEAPAGFSGGASMRGGSEQVKEVMKIEAIIVTAYMGKDNEAFHASLAGTERIWGLYELENAFRSVIWNNKKLKDDNNNLITTGQNPIYNTSRRTYMTGGGNNAATFMSGLNILFEYYRVRAYNYHEG